jgi:hypothetical protein
MRKTLLVIFIFLAMAVLIAFAFSTFFVSVKKARYQDCVLLQDPKTGKVDCFGCYNNICKDATTDWEIYQAPKAGIPYACFKSEAGCQLAQ